jgi:hypothetical protein
LLAPRAGQDLRERLLGRSGPPAPQAAPADARDAVAQVLQYTVPATDESARQSGPGTATPTATAPGL